MAMSTTAFNDEEQIARLLPADSGQFVRVAIFGSVDLHRADSEVLCAAIGRAFAQPDLPLPIILVTGANAAAHAAVSGAFHTALIGHGASLQAANARVVHLYPRGYRCQFGFGTLLPAGEDSKERRWLLAKYCDIAVTVEGGPGTADEMRLAVQFGRVLLPLRRTGAASNGEFGAPPVQRNVAVSESDWALLGDTAAPVQSTAAALLRAVFATVGQVPASQ